MGMSAEALSPDRVRLVCAPWSALDAAKGDTFRVRRGATGELWVEEKLVASGYCAIRIWASEAFFHERFTETVLDRFRPLGVAGSGMFGLVVLDVPPEVDLAAVQHVLRSGEDAGEWRYDELCVTDAWRAVA
jgi:hypothetical protein